MSNVQYSSTQGFQGGNGFNGVSLTVSDPSTSGLTGPTGQSPVVNAQFTAYGLTLKMSFDTGKKGTLPFSTLAKRGCFRQGLWRKKMGLKFGDDS